MPMFWLRTRQVDQRRIQRHVDQGPSSARPSKLDSAFLLLEIRHNCKIDLSQGDTCLSQAM